MAPFNLLELYMTKKNTLIYGVGLNDADYPVKPVVNGMRDSCPFYITWVSMLVRCYSKNYQSKHPAYIGASVCNQWLAFSNFKKWMSTQDFKGKALDKDLLIFGNKIYSPEACVFVDQATNKFTTDSARSRGDYPLGVNLNRESGRFQARCNNPITGARNALGHFTCPDEAHLAWKKRKHELACQLADLQTDERVAAALRLRYA